MGYNIDTTPIKVKGAMNMGMTDKQYQSIIAAILELLKGCETKEEIEQAIRVIQAMQTIAKP